MNPNVWNIKEILSIPTGTCGTKTLSRNEAVIDYSNLTDSQFLFGSQFWPENSQGMSQEMGYSSRVSQQSSQEASDPKISSNYHTKPFLFGGDCKNKGKVPNFNSGKAMGILDRFEEDKKKSKEKCESDILAAECLQFRENLENMKLSISGIDKNTTMCKTVLLERFDHLSQTLHKNVSSLQDGITLQFEDILNKVSSQNLTLKETEDRVVKEVDSLQQKLEALTQEQSREQSMLREALSLLGTLISKHSEPVPVRVTDSMVQTSPGLEERSFEPDHSKPEPSERDHSKPEPSEHDHSKPEPSEHDHSKPEPSELDHSKPEPSELDHSKPDPSELDHSQLAVSSKRHGGRRTTAGHRSTQRGCRKKPYRARRRALLPSQTRSREKAWDENSQPLTREIKEQLVGSPLKEQDVSLKPEPLKQHNGKTSSKSTGHFINPFSFCSQESDSSLAWEKLSAKVIGSPRNIWQLFDPGCDSD